MKDKSIQPAQTQDNETESSGPEGTPNNAEHTFPQPPKPKSKKWLWLGLAFVLVGAAAAYWYLIREDEPQASINSYDECVAAGYPVMESYPEQCAVPGGQTFTRQLSEEEQAVIDELMPDDVTTKTEPENKSPLVTELTGDDLVRMTKPGDENQLPSSTPSSFLSYIRNVLEKNTPQEDGCVTQYSVYKVSSVNIAGGIGLTDSNPSGEPRCGGGAGVVWYLEAGKWQRTNGYQSWPPCTWFEDAKVYSEFISTCYVEENGERKEIDNPNGSIDDAGI